MLSVPAFQFRHPVSFLVLMEPNDPLLHGASRRLVLSIPRLLWGQKFAMGTSAQHVAQQLGTLHPRERYTCSNKGRWIVKSKTTRGLGILLDARTDLARAYAFSKRGQTHSGKVRH
jgi:hypothetical protein